MIVGIRRQLLTTSVMASLFMFALPALAQAATPAAAAHHAAKRHHHRRHGIPQHNGGDRDGDNNGAHSDGDGNV